MSTSSSTTISRQQRNFDSAKFNLKMATDALAAAHSDFNAARVRGVKALGAFLDRIDLAQLVVNEAERQFGVAKQWRARSLGINRLPKELLQLVFTLCIGPPTDFAEVNCASARIALRARQLQPFILARVCRLWRDASIEYSRVWSSVELGGAFFLSAPREEWAKYLSTVLLRSGTAGLHIGLYEVYRQDNCEALRMLLPAMVRCTSLAVSGGLRYSCQPLIRLLSSQTPALQTLYLRDDDDYDIGHAVLPYCPLLRTVHSFRCPRSIDLHAVTSLTLERARIDNNNTAQNFVSCLQRVQHLERLELVHPFVGPVINQGLRFPDLRFLSLEYTQLSDGLLIPLATIVLFPNLQELRLSGPQVSWHMRAAYLVALARSSPHIRVLHLSEATDMQGSETALTDALPLLKHLRELVFHGTEFYFANLDTFCRALSDGPVSSWACPDLRRLEFSADCAFAEGNSGPLADMVEARMNEYFLVGGSPALDVALGCAIDEDAALRIVAAVSLGL